MKCYYSSQNNNYKYEKGSVSCLKLLRGSCLPSKIYRAKGTCLPLNGACSVTFKGILTHILEEFLIQLFSGVFFLFSDIFRGFYSK